MRKLLSILLLSGAGIALGIEQPVAPYETADIRFSTNPIDVAVMASLRQQNITPALPCSDEVFIRRVFLDVTGTLPTIEELRSFKKDQAHDKRAALIDELLRRDEHAVYATLRWCDVLRVKAEFPINLWPNAVQAYHHWILQAVRENRPYNEFARELLTTSGSNFREPPVNFYRAVPAHEPADLARVVALTFMGMRLENWPEDRRTNLEAFFSRVAFKRTAEWKEEIVHLDPTPIAAQVLIFPDGTEVRVEPAQDPREVFADWLIDGDNPWFARNIVNRIWAWLFGRGLIHEPDDIRPDNPAVHPEVLDYLATELVRSDYDLHHVYRLILNSRTYQQSPIPRTDHPDAEALFAHYPVRPLDAEVLIDALCRLTGTTESYSSEIPEPFTFVPETQRSIALADGSISSPFLELFGRPARDSGLASERNRQPTDAQRLHLLNSSDIQQKIERSANFRALMKKAKWQKPEIVRRLYQQILSRKPTPPELDTAVVYYATKDLSLKQATDDLAWALINSKEFLYQH